MAMPAGYAGKGGKPVAAWWREQVRLGLEDRKTFAYEPEWNRWREYYRGNWEEGKHGVNLFFMMARSIVPKVYFRNPSVSVVSRRPGFRNLAFAQVLQRTDNKLIRTMKVKQQMKRMVQNTFLFGTSAGKLGFGAEFTPTPKQGGTEAPTVQGADGMVWRPEYRAGIRNNMPWLLPIHPSGLVFPAGTQSFEESRWVGHIIPRPKDDVLNDERLKAPKDLKTTKAIHSSTVIQPGKQYPVETVELVEIRDTQTGKVFLISINGDEKEPFLFEDDELQFYNEPPIRPLIWNPDEESIWGLPDSKIIEPQQREMIEIKTQKMYHRRMALIKILYNQGMIDEEEVDKMLRGDPRVWGIPVKDLSALKPMQIAEVPKDLHIEEEVTMADIREQMGFSRNQAGEFNQRSGDTTATEALIVRMAHELRIDEKRDVLSDLLVDFTYHIHQMIFRHWTQKEVVDVAGPNQMPLFVEFTPNMLSQGEFEVKIDPDTSLPETKDLRQQKAVQMFQLLRDDPLVDQGALRQSFLSEMSNPAFENLMLQLDFGQGGTNPDQALEINDFARVLQAAQAQAGAAPRGGNGAQQGSGRANVPGRTSAEGAASAVT